MTNEVGDAYDVVAKQYAELFCGDLSRDINAVEWLAAFAEIAATHEGTVADLGCGPGHVTNHLGHLGLDVVGSDLSAGQIAEALRAFPDRRFALGDLTAIDAADASLGGIVSRYSIIHLRPADLGDVFAEWLRVLEPGAPALVSFFGATTVGDHAMPFDHTVATAYALFPATVVDLMSEAGFTDIQTGVLDPPEGGRPFDQATVLARSPLP